MDLSHRYEWFQDGNLFGLINAILDRDVVIVRCSYIELYRKLISSWLFLSI